MVESLEVVVNVGLGFAGRDGRSADVTGSFGDRARGAASGEQNGDCKTKRRSETHPSRLTDLSSRTHAEHGGVIFERVLRGLSVFC